MMKAATLAAVQAQQPAALPLRNIPMYPKPEPVSIPRPEPKPEPRPLPLPEKPEPEPVQEEIAAMPQEIPWRMVGELYRSYVIVEQGDNAFRPELSNGAMMDIGVYTLYPLIALFGRPQSINAQGVVLSSGVDGQGAVNMQYDGFNATVLYSKIANSQLPAEIEGEDGNIIIDRIQTPVDVRFYPRQAPASGHEKRTEGESLSAPETHNEYFYEVEEFINLIEQGRLESDINSHDCSIATMEVIDEVRRQLGVHYPADEE